jgi:hypothetical protein
MGFRPDVAGSDRLSLLPKNAAEFVARFPDPIFLVIERHRRADAACETAIATRAAADDDSAMQAERRAYWRLVETVPTTLAGIHALCEHLERYAKRDEQWAEVGDGEFGLRLLANIREAVERIPRGDA